LERNELEKIVELITNQIEKVLTNNIKQIPVGISNRHVHLSNKDKEILFGENYTLTKTKDLKQIGQYACEEVVTIKGPKGEISKVRILGPERKQTQVEVSKSDCIKLGIVAKVMESGNLKGSSPITLIGPIGIISLEEGAIIAKRHIHMTIEEAERFGVKDGQVVSVKVNTHRGGTYDNVIIRSSESYRLEMHIDTDEANAMDIENKDNVEIIK
jgi:propanediol utilization protein